MSHEHLTIEEVDKQIEEIKKQQASKRLDGAGVPIIDKICGIVTLAIPILRLVRGILFFKPAWQAIIDEVISVASLACPQPGTQPTA